MCRNIIFIWKIRLAIEESKDNAFGIPLDNGTWTGMRGRLQKKVFQTKTIKLLIKCGHDVVAYAIIQSNVGNRYSLYCIFWSCTGVQWNHGTGNLYCWLGLWYSHPIPKPTNFKLRSCRDIFSSGMKIYTNMVSGLNSFAMPKLKCILLLQVWIGLLISILVCIGFVKLFTILSNKYHNDNASGLNTLSEISMYIFGTLTNQGEDFVFTYFNFKLYF